MMIKTSKRMIILSSEDRDHSLIFSKGLFLISFKSYLEPQKIDFVLKIKIKNLINKIKIRYKTNKTKILIKNWETRRNKIKNKCKSLKLMKTKMFKMYKLNNNK